MRRNKTISCSVPEDDQAKKNDATSQDLVLFGPPQEAIEIFQENKMTNTEGVNKGIYFSYPCRRQSCALVNIPAPCVNKMISHIESVESKIQEHLQQFETSREEWSTTSSTKEWKEDGSLATPVKEVKPEERDEMCPELKQEMKTLVSEAIRLIKSLETDRAEAEEALKQQKSRKNAIHIKIDSWSIWRLQEIPLAVQKEHEAYLRDIVELQWHIDDKAKQLKHLEEQKEKLEDANAKLQADVDYMNKHGPLINSKLNQELEALKECCVKKLEVTGLYKQVHDELEEAKKTQKIAKLNAKQTKQDMEKDIQNDEAALEAYKRELERLNALISHLSTAVENVNTDIEENEEGVTEVLKETKTSETELSALVTKLDDLKKVYDQLLRKKISYEKEYLGALNNYYATKQTWDIELSNIAKDFSDISVACARLEEENRKLKIDIETITGLINDSIRKKSEFESEIQTLMKLRSKYDEFLKPLYREAYQLGAAFCLTKSKTEELEQKIAEIRRKFKGREDFLKRLTRGKAANGMMIQKRLYSIQEEHLLERQELMDKKAMHTLSAAELETCLPELEEEAMRIRAAHKEHVDILNNIIERKEHVTRNVEKAKKKLQKRGKKTRDAITETEEKYLMISKEIKTTKSKTNMYNEKIDQLNKELREKEKEKTIWAQTLKHLKNQYEAIKYKKEHAQAVFDQLVSEKKTCERRLYEEGQRYTTLTTMRQNTLADIKLCQLQRRLHKVWQNHFKLQVLWGQTRLSKFQTDSQENIQKILALQNQYDSEKE
uniref:Coiled-coil domain containing 178 n=1 Tax=Suricata suricatta TaxID=37032 RepID=A0A673TQ43_SURSU